MVRLSAARGWRLRRIAAFMVMFMWVSSLSPVVAAPVAPVVSQAPTEAVASAAARKQGSRVEVSGRTTQTSRVFAEPSGSFTLEQSALPERVRQGDRWVGVDTSLVSRQDGTLAAKAAAVEMTFSDGGTKPLATLKSGAGSLSLGWRGALPKPAVSGNAATYVDVLPGVDLRVRANVRGFGHDLVVKTPAAAASLTKVSFDWSAAGVTLSVNKEGDTRGVDAAGNLVFQSPAPRMWDAAGKSAAVGLELGNGQLTVVPDKTLLSDPGVRFPVVVDPDWSAMTPERSAWTLVRKALPNNSHLNLEPRDEDERVKGVVRVGRSPDDGSNFIDRSLFRFDTTLVRGARINRATLQVFQLWKNAHSCNPADVAPVELRKTGPIDDGTTWNNQPAWGPALDSARSVGKLGKCPPDWVGLNATGAVQETADAGQTDITLGIKATDADEASANPNGWKRFDSKPGFFPKLFMEFNNPPDAPVDVTTDPPLPEPCKHCGGKSYVHGDRINLQATINDPNGGQVAAVWDIDGQDERVDWQASGTVFSTPLDLRDGATVTWRVKGHDGMLDSPTVEGPTFVVDKVGPDQKPGVEGRLYPADNAWHGGIGVYDAFRFTPNGVTDVAKYRYWFTGGTPEEVDAFSLGGDGAAWAAPPIDGPVTLFVQSLDRAGRPSPQAEYHFYVRAGNGPAANWPLDGNAKDESLSGGRDGTVVGGELAWTPGASGAAARFDGDGKHITAPNVVRTDSGFSVAAWVKLNATSDRTQTAVSQDATATCGFCLSYKGDTKSWAFVMPMQDSATPTVPPSVVETPAQAGRWTHLVGTFERRPEKAGNRVRLYVNGSFIGEVRHWPQWLSAGKVRIGQQFGGVNQFEGAVDDVRMYDRVLSEEDVRALVSKDDIQAAHWRFDEDSGTTAGNSVEGGDAAVLKGGAKFDADAQVNRAVKLSAMGDYVTSSGPVVNTDQSFSVSTWVKLTQAPSAGNAATVVSAEGNEVSAFFLGYRAADGGRWEIHATEKDSSEREADAEVRSTRRAVVGRWTHLTMVYDKPGQAVRLYVDGALSGTAAHTTGFNATGPLIMGHGKWNGIDHANQWLGSVDELRVYSRGLDDAEVRGVFTREAAAAGSWRLDGDTVDDSKNAKHGTAVNGPTFVDGQSINPDSTDKALRFDGVDDYMKAATAVDTSQSFSVAAWVKPDRIPSFASIVSQNGTNTAAFNLGFDGNKHWVFAMHTPDAEEPDDVVQVVSEPVVQPGVWTHVAGSYDSLAKEARLYVNGLLVSTATFEQSWNATGEVNIGRAKFGGRWEDYLPGAVDDVKLYNRPLFQDEVSQLAGRDMTLVHHLKLDETSGTTAADSAGSRVGIITGNAQFATGRQGNAIRLSGGQIATAGADLRMDDSFTVTAWLNLRQSGGQLTAVSVDGARTSKFRLGHVKDPENEEGSWIFEMPENDDNDNRVTRAAVSTRSNELNEWVHLTAVYDAPAKKIWLYVNGTRVGDGMLKNRWQPSGGLVIGRGKLAGEPKQAWPGSVDDVRVYTGRLDKDRVDALYKSYPAPAN